MTALTLDDLNIRFATKGGLFVAGTGRGADSGAGGRIRQRQIDGGAGADGAFGRECPGRLTLGADSFDLARRGVTTALRGSRLAMIFQDPFTALNPAFTVAPHLAEVLLQRWPGMAKPARKAAALEALASVGLPDPAETLRRYPFELSGGMRQRVAIAMALLAAPELLIADEPTTALDASVEAQVLEQLCALRQRIGCSMIIVTHSLGLVAKYCDDIAVMYAGELVESGSVAEVVGTPRHPYTRALLACELTLTSPRATRAIDNRFQMVAGELPSPFALPTGCVFQPRCPAALPGCTASVPPLRAIASDSHHRVSCFLEPK